MCSQYKTQMITVICCYIWNNEWKLQTGVCVVPEGLVVLLLGAANPNVPQQQERLPGSVHRDQTNLLVSYSSWISFGKEEFVICYKAINYHLSRKINNLYMCVAICFTLKVSEMAPDHGCLKIHCILILVSVYFCLNILIMLGFFPNFITDKTYYQIF